MISSSTTAPIVALTIALTMPTPRLMPSFGNNQLPIKAPTIHNQIADKSKPNELASQPAITPTIRTTRRLSPDMFIAKLLEC
jgi:hypothetical protein